MKNRLQLSLISLFLFGILSISYGQIVQVGSGSYTTQFPGTDAAGRNGFPSGTPFVTGIAASKPIPTNDWWSDKVKNSHSSNLFNYPYTLKTTNKGLVASYIPWGPIDDIEPIKIGVSGLNSSSAKVSDFSDWTVTMDWENNGHFLRATAGIGMPLVYFEKGDSDILEVTINEGTVTIIDQEIILVENARYGADFAIYPPRGSSWTKNSNTYTSTLFNQNHLSLAFLPDNGQDLRELAIDYQKYAYVFPTNTYVDYNYDQSTSIVTTNYIVETEVKEGSDTDMLIGLLPHQWSNLAPGSPSPQEATYPTVRGELKTLAGNSFVVENTFHGILPTLPYIDFYSDGFDQSALLNKVKQLENDGLATWTDSYNEGQMMNRLIQTARIAELMGDSIALSKIINTVKERLENWLTYNTGEVAFLFYYNTTWSAMLGYPAGHGQDNNINDHHFHWGYFIHAASFLEQYNPGWAEDWGPMINLLVRDAASPDRNDHLFPFLRNFSPYAGHCWANGFASFPQGNDQESTSESMQFNSSLIHWGAVTGNDSIRDLGIYLYTTEQSAIEEYWFDMFERNFSDNQAYSLVSRVWGNSYDNGTFWTSDIAASYGIQLYPIHGGSLYLGQNHNYGSKLWNEIEQNTGILDNQANPNLWHDLMWKYLSFIDPEKAIELYQSYPDRELKFGTSDAQTYHWLHAMNVLGKVDINITADHPLSAVFSKDGETIYVGQNYGKSPIDISFSDGYVLNVPAGKLVTSLDLDLSGTLSTSFERAHPNGSVDLTVEVNSLNVDKVEFYRGQEFLGTVSSLPYTFTAGNLPLGKHNFSARIYNGSNFVITNSVQVLVGSQKPYPDTHWLIPGSFEAGDYDSYEGGNGNLISYFDTSPDNKGNYRPDEYVDAGTVNNEGNTVGWISHGEWLEYSVDVKEAGYYNIEFRYSCGFNNGGGPMTISSDEVEIVNNIFVNYTGDWDQWSSKTVANVPLKSGKQILRLYFEQREFNIGTFTFAFDRPLDYSQPIAHAGEDQFLQLTQTETVLDASQSSNGGSGNLKYKWTQIYGPSVLTFSNNEGQMTDVSVLKEGVYLIQLEVDNGSYTDNDEMFIITSSDDNIAPSVAITSPTDGSEFYAGDEVNISVQASDLNDSIRLVEIYIDGESYEDLVEAPYETSWSPSEGSYNLTAIAYDYNGASTVSNEILVDVVMPPPCNGTSWNADFSYEFSEDKNNPTLTFIPSQNGVGSPTCILYYGTNPSSLPGYGVTANVPYQINASEGDKIYFYYTYSYPGETERNNAANKDSYVVGTCRNTTSVEEVSQSSIKYYPNPVTSNIHFDFEFGMYNIQLYNQSGLLLDEYKVTDNKYDFDLSEFINGVYIFSIENNQRIKEIIKVIKM